MEFEFAVIGGGIAGSTLTYELIKRKKSVILFDNENEKATTIAGGLINPIMGRKMNIAWREPEVFKFAVQYYKDIEENINCNFLEEKPIFRPFTTKTQKEELILRMKKDKNIRSFILSIKEGKIYDFSFDNDGGMLTKGAIINTNLYIETIKEYFIKKNAYIKAEIDDDTIQISDKSFRLEKFKFEKLIFTRGYKEMTTGLFSYLPFKPAKGEMLILEIEGLKLKEVYNRYVSLIPLQDNKFYLGGTYEWENLDTSTNEWAKEELVGKLKKITKLSYKIIQHKAHVRPSTLDREPFLGEHPKYKNIFILNGLGTRGISMTPYLSKSILDYIEKKSSLPTYYDIYRYLSFYKETSNFFCNISKFRKK
ncbi:FAD-dependent oxidoreductase [Borrelia sp. BU AG58]|uniref:NAD(P)/FAD-dependent oxidoreductase n=1 Tax=Borrelia sp. BU AG58 TaxID=2887345 RepID=UPI001E5A4344|nr:FAD-dependent oxidoreductase [Borrelia sp. BU AG58]UER67899.1 FAD-dependent oxidoreductase [Borrelia sp. BU AG58]